eukprot:TRINITY_DN2234_c1_g1_i3.p1 TRINITY_DN2234_c1_g1~~TRINITY_DN2234_c1_g1_i3.p1  ORF type:complete len:125 (-),score=38.48 TRINITY_DN2234_c1_g1_i3:152-526(-)
MSDSILTIRLIRSFEYRTTKNMILTGLCLSEITVSQLKSMIREKISSNPSFKAYQNLPLDTLKIYSKAHGAKSQNLIMNLENEEWMLEDDDEILSSRGIEHETELSFFNKEAYLAFKSNPQTKW